MLAQWTGEVVGRMHIYRITNRMLASQIGCTEEYVSAVLNGRREPKGAEEKFRQAVDELCREASSKV